MNMCAYLLHSGTELNNHCPVTPINEANVTGSTHMMYDRLTQLNAFETRHTVVGKQPGSITRDAKKDCSRSRCESCLNVSRG